MDDDLFHKITIAGFFIIAIIGVFTIQLLITANNNVAILTKTGDCGQVVDIIYDQCNSEGNINLTTIKGRTKTLEYRDGVCVIK